MGTRWLLLVLLVVEGGAEECHLCGPLDLGRSLFNDSVYVTVPFTPGTIVESEHNDTRFRVNDFCVGEHTGTHLDAPYHYNDNGWAIEQIPLNRLIANGVFLNLTEQVARNASFRLQPSHIDAWIEQHGEFPDNAILLISYGWAQLYSNRTLYLGTMSTNFTDFHFPGMSKEAASRLADIDELVGVGVDTKSLDPPDCDDAHTILAAKNIYNLELLDLNQPCLPAKGFTVYSMPVKVSHGTGAPARVVVVPSD